MGTKDLFDRWVEKSGIAVSEELYSAFKAGYEAAQRQGLVIYGALNRHEWDLLMDDLSYWFGEEAGIVGGGKRKKVYLTLENFCKAYVLSNLLVSKGRFRRRGVNLRDRNRVIKKYYRKKIYLWGSMYFKFLCKRFGVLERRKTRMVLIELAARKKWWPLCAWDIAMARPIMRHPKQWNLEKVISRVPDKWKEDMEKLVLAYFGRKD